MLDSMSSVKKSFILSSLEEHNINKNKVNFTFEIKDGEFLIIEARPAEIIVIDAMTSEATTKGAL